MRQNIFTSMLLASASLIAAHSAIAQTIYIGLQESTQNGGNIKVVAEGDASGVTFGKGFGKWTFNGLTSFDDNGADFLSSASNVTKTKGLTPLHVWYSEADLTAAVGTMPTVFTTTLTQNDVPAGWTVTENAYLNLGNAPMFGTTTPIASETFTSEGTVVQKYTVPAITGPYELTEEVTITLAKGADLRGDGVLSTIDVATTGIPEASTWAMMTLGFAGLAIAGFRRGRRGSFGAA